MRRFIEGSWFREAVSVGGSAVGAAHTNRYTATMCSERDEQRNSGRKDFKIKRVVR
jgi:hypothetical protein